MYKYFISYTFFLNNGSYGVGNIESTVDGEIEGLNDIKVIEKSILDGYEDCRQVIINNYIQFPDLRKY